MSLAVIFHLKNKRRWKISACFHVFFEYKHICLFLSVYSIYRQVLCLTIGPLKVHRNVHVTTINNLGRRENRQYRFWFLKDLLQAEIRFPRKKKTYAPPKIINGRLLVVHHWWIQFILHPPCAEAVKLSTVPILVPCHLCGEGIIYPWKLLRPCSVYSMVDGSRQRFCFFVGGKKIKIKIFLLDVVGKLELFSGDFDYFIIEILPTL